MIKAFAALSVLLTCSVLFTLGCSLFAASVTALEDDPFDVI
jgi:hypothetical protein